MVQYTNPNQQRPQPSGRTPLTDEQEELLEAEPYGDEDELDWQPLSGSAQGSAHTVDNAGSGMPATQYPKQGSRSVVPRQGLAHYNDYLHSEDASKLPYVGPEVEQQAIEEYNQLDDATKRQSVYDLQMIAEEMMQEQASWGRDAAVYASRTPFSDPGSLGSLPVPPIK